MTNNTNQQNEDHKLQQKHSIRVFVSSTFRDMIEDRNALMSHTWPELRLFCRERQVELVEVDMRWGIAEEQNTRKETLKLCLDEIRACRPFFIGLLGERYGWVPGSDAFTADLKEEQTWLEELQDKSVTELEILHGVLNDPETAGRAFFYFRDPDYAQEHGPDFLPENDHEAEKQAALKTLIRKTCEEKSIPLHETYSDPGELAALVLEQLKGAIEEQFPEESILDPLEREARDHEAFAEIRRRTYIGRPDYYEALDQHVAGEGAPVVLLGDSGSGKSALLANWIDRWRESHPNDFIFQHYIGGTSDSAVHWKLMTRLMVEIKRWTDDPEELPHSNDDMLRDFPLWLSKARIKAEREGVHFIVVLDALNQLEDKDRGRLLGWLPEHPFTGALRLIVSTLPGETLEVLEKRQWTTLHIRELSTKERRSMIVEYLFRFGKKLDDHRLDRLADSEATANPLYLKILLDELRVTGTHERLDERLDDYLAAKDIPGLLSKVLTRYQQDYEHDRKGLVKDALGMICAARRGLTEVELLELLRPDHLPKLPLATWTPLRAALEEGLVDRGGILNFAHDFLRTTVQKTFLPDLYKRKNLREVLSDYFEAKPITERNCDELLWLLWKTELNKRLRSNLLNIDRFIEMRELFEDEILAYWIHMNKEKSMGEFYLNSYEKWVEQGNKNNQSNSYAPNELGYFLLNAGLHADAKTLMERALVIDEENHGIEHPKVAHRLNNLGEQYRVSGRLKEAESLLKRALKINEKEFGKEHPLVANSLNSLAMVLKDSNQIAKAEDLLRRSLRISEEYYGKYHPAISNVLTNFASLLRDNKQYEDAESLMRRALKIDENNFGKDHQNVANVLCNLAWLLHETRQYEDAESLFRRALKIYRKKLGKNHPQVAWILNNLAQLLTDTNRFGDGELMIRQSIRITEDSFGKDHTTLATTLVTHATLLRTTKRQKEAEPLFLRAFKILKNNLGEIHPYVAHCLGHLAGNLKDSNFLMEAELVYRKAINLFELIYGRDNVDNDLPLEMGSVRLQIAGNRKSERTTGHMHMILENVFGEPNLENINCIINSALFHDKWSNSEETELLYRRALEMRNEILGPKHIDTADSLNDLAVFLNNKGDFDEAEPLYRRALAIREKILGIKHPGTALSQHNLALLLNNKDEIDEAEPLYRNALAIFENDLSVEDTDTAACLNNLAVLLVNKGDDDEAEKLYRKSLAIRKKVLGMEHTDTAESLHNLAVLLVNNGDFNEAETFNHQALVIRAEVLGLDHTKTAETLYNLAALLYYKSDYDGSEPLYREAKTLGMGNSNIASTLYQLGSLIFYNGSGFSAVPYYQRALEIYEKIVGSKIDATPQFLTKMAVCHNQIAFHDNIPNKDWKSAEDHYIKAMELFSKSEDQLEMINAELNLQIMYKLSGQKYDLERINEMTESLEEAGDDRAEKGRKILEDLT